MDIIPTAVWDGVQQRWQAVLCIPFVRAVWRGPVYPDWTTAAEAAEVEHTRQTTPKKK